MVLIIISSLLPISTLLLNQQCIIGSMVNNYQDGRALKTSQSRSMSFSGYDWEVRTSNQNLEGPGPNYFSDGNENVWLDENGYLHLKIVEKQGLWYCAEVYSKQSFGHGTYVFTLAPGFENLDVNVVVGLFTYLDDFHEIDIEFARWGQSVAQDGQYTIQPSAHLGNLYRFDMKETDNISHHGFEWCEDYISFWSANGSYNDESKGPVISEWVYFGKDNPEPSSERVHMNLWLMEGKTPINSEEAEIIIMDFDFIPSDCDTHSIGIYYLYWLLFFLAIGAVLSVLIILIIIKYKNR
jgi:hypothetical protein